MNIDARSSSSTSNAQQNASLSRSRIPFPSGAHSIFKVLNCPAKCISKSHCDHGPKQGHSLAGIPTHSATSSVSPVSSSLIHSSLHRYMLPLPQVMTRFPLRTGFHFAAITGLACIKTLLNLGDVEGDTSGRVGTFCSDAEGREYRKIAVGADSN